MRSKIDMTYVYVFVSIFNVMSLLKLNFAEMHLYVSEVEFTPRSHSNRKPY